MKKTIYAVVLLSVLAWLIPELGAVADWSVWAWRKQLIYFTGLASFLLMSLVMLLAVRPRWLEQPLGGLDQMYLLHKWAGIWSVVLGVAHYGLKLAKWPMLLVFEEAVKGGRIKTFLEVYRSSAKELGEWSVWLLVLMVVLALWQRFPYHLWRYVHKALGAFYLVIVFHSIVLTPPQWWLQPSGMLIAAASLIGSWCALLSLTGRIGRKQLWQGEVLACEQLADDCFELTCQLPKQWQHEPGQFAFLRLDSFEGAHPFTIASADQGDGRLRFAIKALGDYTSQMAARIQVGQRVAIEGPYGCFNLPQTEAREQVWIGAGIGITPFLAWLESLQQQPEQEPNAKLYYCVNNAQEAVFADRLQQLCAALPSIELHLHYSQEQGYLQAGQVFVGNSRDAAVWFCGPQQFSDGLRKGAAAMGLDAVRIHQEAFRMR